MSSVKSGDKGITTTFDNINSDTDNLKVINQNGNIVITNINPRP